MTKTRNALFGVLLSFSLITVSACGSNHSSQLATPPTMTTNSHARQAQTYVLQNPHPECDQSDNTCWIIPCDLCSAPIAMLSEAYYVGGGGGGSSAPPPPPTDPVDQISVPNASSTGQLASPGDRVPCVTSTGDFTAGCGGIPGQSGQGIGVFYDTFTTCYWNFQSLVSVCFDATNRPPNMQPGSDLTTTYCYDPKKLKTQHWFNVPDSNLGSETFDTYLGADNHKSVAFTTIPPHQGLGLVDWGTPPLRPAIQNSTSHVMIFSNVTLSPFPIAVPEFAGFALRTRTDSTCTQSF
ncbi:MAG: hypothetical protein M3N13_10570 [Candidatus Eremiobacteraeota bacterium]|nr:hypothetical protein [Candidatus Eremiobacteraeota bacterium]